jgi:hypothetical protein
LDSCRDRDCFEDVRVYLSDFGNEILEHTGAIRAKSAKIVWSCIGIDPIQFNHGFYSITIRFYVKICFEACVGGGRSHDLDGIAVLEKRVILYGGESNVNVFKSNGANSGFCCQPEPCSMERNLPTAIVEVVDPIVLGSRIYEKVTDCNCCCCCCDIPEGVCSTINGALEIENGEQRRRFLAVSIGLFSVIRITRPGQFIINASEFCVPDKECISPKENDPCSIFRTMAFPTGEFCSQSIPCIDKEKGNKNRCGC